MADPSGPQGKLAQVLMAMTHKPRRKPNDSGVFHWSLVQREEYPLPRTASRDFREASAKLRVRVADNGGDKRD